MSMEEIKNSIINSNLIGITFHTSPDGDAIGSALGLLNGLRTLGKNSYITSRDIISDNLLFLPLGEEVTDEISSPKEGTDLVIVVDCGNKERISSNLENYKEKVINIDHHASNEYFGHINYVDTNAAATAEIIYALLKELGFKFDIKDPILENIGTCLYTSLVTDTGSFRHSNVTKKTHTIAGELIGIGVNNTLIHRNLYENVELSKVKLLGAALDKLELHNGNKIAVIALPLNLLESYNLSKFDTSEVISTILAIKGIEVAIVLKETLEGVKASLRSKDKVDVKDVAAIFGGGGHPKAAGVMQKNITLDDAKNNLIEAVGKVI